jgi:hypothetical protein
MVQNIYKTVFLPINHSATYVFQQILLKLSGNDYGGKNGISLFSLFKNEYDQQYLRDTVSSFQQMCIFYCHGRPGLSSAYKMGRSIVD